MRGHPRINSGDPQEWRGWFKTTETRSGDGSRRYATDLTDFLLSKEQKHKNNFQSTKEEIPTGVINNNHIIHVVKIKNRVMQLVLRETQVIIFYNIISINLLYIIYYDLYRVLR